MAERPRGNIFYEIVILILIIGLIGTILYPSRVWQNEEELQDICRNRMDAISQLQYGLIHQVVAPDNLDQAASDMARRLLEVPAKALELSKRIILTGYDLTLREGQDLELEIVADLLASPETKKAFIQYAKNQGLME